MNQVYFYFDYLSPYAYLAWGPIQVLCAKRGLALHLHPVLFAGLLTHWGQLGPAEIPPKREFVYKDCYREAMLQGLPFNGPSCHPFNPLLALRISLAEISAADQTRVVDALWKASWGDGIDMSNPQAIKAALDQAGLNGAELVEAAQSPQAKDALRRETEAALARGVFGVPTVIVGDELFWGHDRLSHLELYLDGKDPLDRTQVMAMLSRPRGSDRRAIRAAPVS